MKNHMWKTSVVGMTAAALISACSSSSGGTATGGATTEKHTETPAPVKEYYNESGEIVIQDMTGGPEETFNKSYGEFIKKKFPNLKVTFIQSKTGSTLQDLTMSGVSVDIVYASMETISSPLLGAGQQFDMTELIKEQGVDLTKFEQTTIDAVRSMGEGKIYYLPVTTMIQVLFYNKGIFDKLGVPYPKDGMTWDEAKELNTKLTRNYGGINYMGISASSNHIMRMNQMSVPFYDPKTKKPMLTDERWKTALETYFTQFATSSYKAFTEAKKKLPYYTEMTNTQELAMMVFNSQFPFDGPQYVKDVDWDLVSLPVFKDKPKQGSQASPRMFAITNGAKNKDMAMAIIKYLTSVEMQTEFSKQGYMTVLNDENVKALIGSGSAFSNKNWKAVYYNTIAPKSYQSIYDGDILQKYLTPNVVKVVTGEMDINTALRNAQEQAEKFIEAQQAK